jgi:transcriptional regulator with XRE-family HTH domain
MNSKKLKSSTRKKRDLRKAERAVLRENNKIGDRLVFIREKLGITRSELSEGACVRPSTLSDWETGIRTKYYEWIGVIAKYCDELWKEKYKDGPFPMFNGAEIDEITLEFILMGENPTLDVYKKMASEAEQKAAEMAIRWESNKLLEQLESGQMDMFEGDTDGKK